MSKKYVSYLRVSTTAPRQSGFGLFASRRRHTRYWRDWSSDVCSSDLNCASKIVHKLNLSYSVTTRYGNYGGSYLFPSIMKAQTTGKKSITISYLNEIISVGSCTCQRTGHYLRPS